MNHIYLTRRNLLTLLSKLDRAAYGSATARTIMKLDAKHPRYPSTPTTITAVEDHDYYTDRRPGPTTEAEMLRSQIPWLQVIDEALVINHLNVANFSDSYEVARKKFHDLIHLEIRMATDPVINGGLSLQPVEPKLPNPQVFFEDLRKVPEATFFGDK
jgi:hypothetical protein